MLKPSGASPHTHTLSPYIYTYIHTLSMSESIFLAYVESMSLVYISLFGNWSVVYRYWSVVWLWLLLLCEDPIIVLELSHTHENLISDSVNNIIIITLLRLGFLRHTLITFSLSLGSSSSVLV